MGGTLVIARDRAMDAAHFEQALQNLCDKDEKRGWRLDFDKVVSAKYSAGFEIDGLRGDLSDWIEFAATRATVHQVVIPGDTSEPLCFAVLMGCNDTDRQGLADILAGDPNPFAYTNFSYFLAGALGLPHRAAGGDYLQKFFPKVRALSTSVEREAFLGNYMRRYWYQANRSDLNPGNFPPNSRYVGYWAWDIAATVRVWGLDDSSFCDHKYYPKDLAHYLGPPKAML